MPDDHLYRFLSDQEAQGESPANRNASAREYERYSEAFPLDPGRCEALLDLPPDTLESLVARWNEAVTKDSDAEDAVLRDAAEELK